MDIIFLIIGFIFLIIGIIGALVPVLPGPPLSWIGLLSIYLTSVVPVDYTILGITLLIAVLITLLDYLIPVWGTKKFGGSTYGVIGTSVGLIVGLIIPIPLGIVIGAFFGALFGELYFAKQNSSRALKASVGSVIGFFVATGLKLAVSIIYLWLFIKLFWEYKSDFFTF